MRETCARVLAAALMTGAIAIVVGMAAHLGTTADTGRPIAAPPSSLQRTVRLTARPVPRPRPSAVRLVTAIDVRPTPRAVARLVVTKHRAHRPAPRRQLAASEPVPPAPGLEEPETHGHGHAYGRDRQED